MATKTQDILARFGLAIAQDSFVRGNLSSSTSIATGWGTPSDNPPTSDTWASAGSGTPSFALAGNEGQVTGTTANVYALLGSGTDTNTDITARFSITATADGFGVFLSYTGTGNHYR